MTTRRRQPPTEQFKQIDWRRTLVVTAVFSIRGDFDGGALRRVWALRNHPPGDAAGSAAVDSARGQCGGSKEAPLRRCRQLLLATVSTQEVQNERSKRRFVR